MKLLGVGRLGGGRPPCAGCTAVMQWANDTLLGAKSSCVVVRILTRYGWNASFSSDRRAIILAGATIQDLRTSSIK
jgi:hypothetical protein